MDWIFEKVFELVKDILKGDFSDLDKLPALIAVIGVFGCFLARKQIWKTIQDFTKRIREFARFKRLESEVKENQRRIKEVAVDIRGKIREINTQTSLFATQKSETLERLKVLKSTLPDNSELHSLMRNVDELSETHELSIKTIKEINYLLKQITDVSRADELGEDPDAYASELLGIPPTKQSTRHSKNK